MTEDTTTHGLFDEEIGEPIAPPERTEELPVIVYNRYTEIELSDTDYKLVATPGKIYHIKNKSGYPVYVAFSKSGDTLTSDEHQQMIGGLTYEVTTDEFSYTWVRASRQNSLISIRPSGTVDPTADLASLGNALNDLVIKFEEHQQDVGNPHDVDKEQVGLGNIPNAISSLMKANSVEELATTALTYQLYRYIWRHVINKNNPHRLNKHQINLGNVDNYRTADVNALEDCLATVNDLFVTPAVAHRIAKMATAVAFSTKPQLVVECPMGDVPNGWMLNECDRPPAYLLRTDGAHVTIKTGLVVSYGSEHKVRISEPLALDIVLPIDLETDGRHYVYVDINPEGLITGAGTTVLAPIYDTERRFAVGDFFNIATCEMFDKDDNPIRRVYIGTVIVDSNLLSNIVPLPLGDTYTFPLEHTLVLSGRYLLDNPYMTRRVNVKAEVLYADGWQVTGWNDQIGISAGVHPVQSAILAVQCGQMGFLSCGRESGSLFGSAFTTVTSSLRTRIVVQRDF